VGDHHVVEEADHGKLASLVLFCMAMLELVSPLTAEEALGRLKAASDPQ
jgi:hypothetical protein